MADGIELNAGSGGATVKTDDDGTFHWQYVKLAYGADNTQTIVTSTATNPLPVALSDTDNAVLDSIATAVQLIDNAVSGAGFNITQFNGAAVPIGAGVEATAVRVTLATDSTGVISVDDNGGSLTIDNAALSVTGGGVEASALRVTLASDSTGVLSVDDNGASLTVDNAALSVTGGGVEASALRVTIATDSTGVLSVDDNGGSITVDNAALSVTGGGVEATALRVTIASDSTGVLSIDDNGGSLTVDGSVSISSLPASTNTIEVVGDVAHDAAAAGNPVLIAARATNSVEGLTQVAAADSTFITADLNGCVVTRPHTTLEEIITERVSNTDGTSTAFTNFAAGGAGIHNYITTFSVFNSSATDGYVDIRDGAAGSILFTLPAPATGGSIHSFPVPLKQTTANTALAYDVSGALTTVYISAIGFQAQG